METRRPAPPASGFPGSRATTAATAEEARAVARRAHGANDVPCPIHPAMIVPCGRCAHAALNSDPARITAAQQQARAALRAATYTATDTAQEPTE